MKNWDNTPKINTGIIGFGLSGRVFHAPFLHSHPGFSLRKIVERSSDESRSLYPYVEVLRDHSKLLEDHSIELVVVASPNTSHFPMVRDSLLAGKHVIVEKPFTPTIREADELISVAEKTDKKIFVYHNRRWDGDFLTIKKIVQQGLLGKLSHFEAHFDRYAPEMQGNWRDQDLPGGGILYDLGAHLIDQALQLFGRPSDIKADIESQRKNSPVDDYFRLELSYPDLVVILTAGMMVKEHTLRYLIKGSHGSYIKYGIDPQEDALKKGMMPGGPGWGREDQGNWGQLDTIIHGLRITGQIETLPGNYMAFYENVAEVIRCDGELAVKAKEAREVIALIEQAFGRN